MRWSRSVECEDPVHVQYEIWPDQNRERERRQEQVKHYRKGMLCTHLLSLRHDRLYHFFCTEVPPLQCQQYCSLQLCTVQKCSVPFSLQINLCPFAHTELHTELVCTEMKLKCKEMLKVK